VVRVCVNGEAWPVASLRGLDLVRSGSLASRRISLPPVILLKAGTYRVSVQADLASVEGGEWLWKKQASAQGHPATWRNPWA